MRGEGVDRSRVEGMAMASFSCACVADGCAAVRGKPLRKGIHLHAAWRTTCVEKLSLQPARETPVKSARGQVLDTTGVGCWALSGVELAEGNHCGRV